MSTLPRNIIIFSVDSLRFDCISRETDRTYLKKYGVEDLPYTPNMDRISEMGVHFKTAVTVAPYTSSSNASLFTGTYPYKHKCRANFYNEISTDVFTLPQIVKKNGYRTSFLCDIKGFFQYLGMCRDVDFMRDNRAGTGINGKNDKELFSHLNEMKNERNFLFVQFIDINNPYCHSPSEIYPGYNDDYFNEINDLGKKYFDVIENDECDRGDKYYFWKELKQKMYASGKVCEIFEWYIRGVKKFDNGRFRWFIENLDGMGLLEDSLLIITADHGEMDLGFDFSHGNTLKDEAIRIPLVMYWPDRLPCGKVIEDQVSVVDILPTILDLSGMELPDNINGKSLVPIINAEHCGQRSAYSEVWAYPAERFTPFFKKCTNAERLIEADYDVFLKQRSLRKGKYKYILNGNDDVRFEIKGEEQLVEWLCREIWGRYSNSDDLSAYPKKLRSGELTKRDLVRVFLNNSCTLDKHSLYDLDNDPFEEHNLLNSPTAKQYLHVAIEMQEELDKLSHHEDDKSVYSVEPVVLRNENDNKSVQQTNPVSCTL